jgi:transposase
MQYIAFDSHKKYTFVSVARPDGGLLKEGRIEHKRGAIKTFLSRFEPHSPVAVETTGNWYWIVNEIEQAGMLPQLVHARRAKLMMGMVNKTDKLDARGMNQLQRNGTLPVVWIPPEELRDKRELPRTRMIFSHQRTEIKNRIHANLAKYALQIDEVTDIFGAKGRSLLEARLSELPEHCQATTKQWLKELEFVEQQIETLDTKIKAVFEETADRELLQSLPGVGPVLSLVILLEVGDVHRFPVPDHLASYAGTTPRVHSSGGKTRHGQIRSDVNRYLKYAFLEAANQVAVHRNSHPDRHVSQLYARIREKKGHQKAVGAVARHLAEAAHVILNKQKAYQDPVSSRKGSARIAHES